MLSSRSELPELLPWNKARWSRVKFGDAVRQVKDSVDPDASGLSRYIAGEHMSTDELRLRAWGRIGDGYLGPAFHCRFRAGQVLYGSRRTYLRKVAVPDFDGVCANTTFVCEAADERLLREFLPVVMQLDAFHAHSVAQSKGSVNPYINWKDIAWFEFRLPPLDVQRRIAALLGAARGHAEALEALASKATQAASAQFAERAFVRHDGAFVALLEVFSGSPDSGCSAPERAETTGHYVLGLQALTGAGYRPGQFKNVDPTDEMLRARLSRGDVLVSRSNTIDRVGFAAIFDENQEAVSFPDTMMRLRLDEERALPEYVVRALMSAHGRRHMRRVAAGTSASMKKINRVTLGSFELPLPPLDEQRDAVNATSAAERVATSATVARQRAVDLGAELREELMM